MSTALRFLLVHGSFHGAWAWDAVVVGLERRGHTVAALDLEGVAGPSEREVDLGTHVEQLRRALDEHPGDAITLVGHSYAGLLLPAVADHPSIERLIFVDAFVPEPGDSAFALLGPFGETLRAQAAAADDDCIPAPPATVFGLEGAQAAEVDARLRPMPAATHEAPAPAGLEAVPDDVALGFVLSDGPPDFTAHAERLRAAGGRIERIRSGHDAMLIDPETLVERLLAV